jgi:hypothetical protein
MPLAVIILGSMRNEIEHGTACNRRHRASSWVLATLADAHADAVTLSLDVRSGSAAKRAIDRESNTTKKREAIWAPGGRRRGWGGGHRQVGAREYSSHRWAGAHETPPRPPFRSPPGRNIPLGKGRKGCSQLAVDHPSQNSTGISTRALGWSLSRAVVLIGDHLVVWCRYMQWRRS